MAQYLPSLSRSCKGFALLAASGLLAGGAWMRARAQSAELTAQKDLQVEENQAAEAAATDKFSSTRENINDAQGKPIAKVKVFTEDMREQALPTREFLNKGFNGYSAQTYLHETGHTVGGRHTDPEVMNPTDADNGSEIFSGTTLRRMMLLRKEGP